MAKKPRYMSWFPERWKADPHVAVMASATRSGYREIIDAMWLSGGSLPDDDDVLLTHSRMTTREWAKGRDQIRARLTQLPDGSLTQVLVQEQYQYTVDLMAVRSKAGKRGAEIKWQSHGKQDGKEDSKRDDKGDDKEDGKQIASASNARSDSYSSSSSSSCSPEEFQEVLSHLVKEHPGSYNRILTEQYLSVLSQKYPLESILQAHRDALKVWSMGRFSPDLHNWLAAYDPKNKLVTPPEKQEESGSRTANL